MSRRQKVILFVSICLLIIATGAAYIRTYYVVPIIMYHSIHPFASRQTPLRVSPATFEKQLAYLKKHRYAVMPVEQLAGLIRERKRIPPHTLAITLDDGYKDNYTYAFPIIKKYQLPVTLFVITQEVGRPDRLSWDEILTMQDSGLVTIGSHTIGPEPLTKISSPEELRRQIFDSKRILENKLGRPVKTFSYPEGRFNAAIRQMVIDAQYDVAVATNPGKRYPSDDIFVLKRLRISENSANLFVFWFETSGFYTFLKEHRKR